MAKFDMQLPDQVLKDFNRIYDNSDEILGGMTKAGAEVAERNIRANAPSGIKQESEVMRRLKVSRTYKTPSDGAINTQAAFFYNNGDAYFNNKGGQRVAIPMLLNAYEYGKSQRRSTKAGANRGIFPKHPFIRKSFRKAQIEKAMLDAQKRLSGGLLDD